MGEDYEGYRQRNMTVHLDSDIEDNEAMLSAWAHMARAQVFIMSQSSFSIVPAYMNTNCVIYPSSIDAPLENWVNGKEETRKSYRKELEGCVSRGRKLRAEGPAPPCDLEDGLDMALKALNRWAYGLLIALNSLEWVGRGVQVAP